MKNSRTKIYFVAVVLFEMTKRLVEQTLCRPRSDDCGEEGEDHHGALHLGVSFEPPEVDASDLT